MYKYLLPTSQLALKLTCLAATYEDMIEIGTPLIKSTGVGIISHLKVAKSNRPRLGDVSMDGILFSPDITSQPDPAQATEKIAHRIRGGCAD